MRGRERDPEREDGVPAALGLAVRRLIDELGAEAIHRLWLFPPIRGRRRERGLVAVSARMGEGGRPDGRLLLTLGYSARLTGQGVEFSAELREEGEVPADRLPRIIRGVLERSEVAAGDPREVALEGDPGAARDLLAEWADLEGMEEKEATQT